MKWYNEPPTWEHQESIITVTSGAKTDFWRRTHYCVRDNGHFYYQEVTGDFTTKVKIIGKYQNSSDHAGLMIRVDEKTWLKSGVEFVNNMQYISAVVTRNDSEWSVVPLGKNPDWLWLRLQRRGSTVEVQYSLDGKEYNILKTTDLTEKETVQVGLVCACPEDDGFQVTFEDFQIETMNSQLEGAKL
ncbi:DUF1349 domain-containing protein [Fischerella sp. PCC 9605]|uniref:DUF1349 domain-containing protein n=1 Tax=Fischerella sp. PCC 9605 TaxID=1173024 RepID=UPI00047CF158|nr:DUF1349 domain-containing protein [Fischerella sp. PCC 9605]